LSRFKRTVLRFFRMDMVGYVAHFLSAEGRGSLQKIGEFMTKTTYFAQSQDCQYNVPLPILMVGQVGVVGQEGRPMVFLPLTYDGMTVIHNPGAIGALPC
jgi:hypothetical protein